MPCKKYSKELLPLVNGELTGQRAKEIRDWLAACSSERQCSECQNKIDEYNAIKTALAAIPSDKLPPQVHYRILDSVHQMEKSRHGLVVKQRWKAIQATMAILVSFYFGSLISIKIFNTTFAKAAATPDLFSLRESSLIEVFTTEGVTP